MHATQTQLGQGWDRWLQHAVVSSENQSRVGSGSRERGGGDSRRTAMTVAVMRDGTDKSPQKVARGLIGRRRRVMRMRGCMMTVRSSGVGVPVMRAETRAQRPAQWEHGKHRDNHCADAPAPGGIHHSSIRPISRTSHFAYLAGFASNFALQPAEQK
jgi:hypothetical protein